MSIRKGRIALIPALVLMLDLAVPLAAQINQMNRIAYFRNVPINFDLQFKKSALARGMYDLEFMRVPNTKTYYLRIMRKGKILHLVQGENFPYVKKTEVSRAPRLNMNRDAATNMFVIVVESGAYTRPYSNIRARYCIACQGAEMPEEETAAEAADETPKR